MICTSSPCEFTENNMWILNNGSVSETQEDLAIVSCKGTRVDRLITDQLAA
jgi:hypothetical protein